MAELEDEEWECPRCHTSPSLGEGMEIPDHRLCWPCASDEVTKLREQLNTRLVQLGERNRELLEASNEIERLQTHVQEVTEKWEKHANELALFALDKEKKEDADNGDG